jgi:hypothetical protein
MINIAVLTDKNNPPDDPVHDTEKKDTNFKWIYVLWIFLGTIGLGLICWGLENLFSMWNRYKVQQEIREDQKKLVY